MTQKIIHSTQTQAPLPISTQSFSQLLWPFKFSLLIVPDSLQKNLTHFMAFGKLFNAFSRKTKAGKARRNYLNSLEIHKPQKSQIPI